MKTNNLKLNTYQNNNEYKIEIKKDEAVISSICLYRKNEDPYNGFLKLSNETGAEWLIGEKYISYISKLNPLRLIIEFDINWRKKLGINKEEEIFNLLPMITQKEEKVIIYKHPYYDLPTKYNEEYKRLFKKYLNYEIYMFQILLPNYTILITNENV